MSVRTEIEPHEHLVRQYIEGELDLAELQMHIDEVIGDPRVTKEYGTLSYIGDLTNLRRSSGSGLLLARPH